MSLDGENLDKMADETDEDMDEAFDLLLQPLAKLLPPDQQAIILIDALDEGDRPALRLINTCLAGKLPKNVRFIFTTRQVPHYVFSLKSRHLFIALVFAILSSTIPLLPCPCILHRPDAMCNQIGEILNRTFEAEGGVSYFLPGNLFHGQEEGGGGRPTAGRVFVYDTVIQECKVAPTKPVAVPTLSDLDDVYRAVFDRRKPVGEVFDLLCVLMAAQEPLPLSLLQQMGLEQHLKDLPGWWGLPQPCLIYVAEHRVFLLHKSLGDWLRDSTRSGDHAVNILRGHALLGQHLLRLEIRRVQESSEGSKAAKSALKYAFFHLCTAARGAGAAAATAQPLGGPLGAGAGGGSLEFLRQMPQWSMLQQVVLSNPGILTPFLHVRARMRAGERWSLSGSNKVIREALLHIVHMRCRSAGSETPP